MKYYYLIGLTKQKLKDLGATTIIPASFSYMYGLHPGHTDGLTEMDEKYLPIEWVFASEIELLLSIAFVCKIKPVELSKRHFNALQRGESPGINTFSELHPILSDAKFEAFRSKLI
jgi:hypothetical protein